MASASLAGQAWAVATARSGPDAMPGSLRALLVAAAAWYAATVAVNMQVLPDQGTVGALGALVELGLLWGFAWVLLAMARKRERWAQLAVALASVQALLDFLRLPLTYLVEVQGSDDLFLRGFRVVLMAWWVWATGRVFMRGVDGSVMFGVAATVFYMLLIMVGYGATAYLVESAG